MYAKYSTDNTSNRGYTCSEVRDEGLAAVWTGETFWERGLLGTKQVGTVEEHRFYKLLLPWRRHSPVNHRSSCRYRFGCKFGWLVGRCCIILHDLCWAC